jgi:hypothetical protein
MKFAAAKVLLASSAAICMFGGIMHAIAYAGKASQVISSSGLPAFFAAELKVLWLADTTTLMAVSLVFALIAAKPQSASRGVMMLLAIVPAAITVLLYFFLGPFYAGHMLLIASAMALAAGVILPAQASVDGVRR